MPLEFYTFLHVVGAIITLMALGAAAASSTGSFRKVISIQHGLGLLLLLVAGFGMLAKLKLGFPAWVIVKLLIWLGLGGLLVIIRKKTESAMTFWWIAILLAAASAFLGIYKPF